MVEHQAHGSVLHASKACPCRHQSRFGRRQERLHPYKREPGPLRQASALIQPKASANGNGKTATLSKEMANGVQSLDMGSSIPGIFHLMEDVAAGKIDPLTAASHMQEVGSLMSKTVEPEIEVEPDMIADGSQWGEGSMPAEIVWAPGKTASQLAVSLQRIMQTGSPALAVRVPAEIASEVAGLLPEVKHNGAAKLLNVIPSGSPGNKQRLPGTVAIVTDDSAQESVLQETVAALSVQGCYAYKLTGAGGPNSLPNLSAADSASVVVVIAGGRSPLPGVVASSITPPVIVVPTTDSIARNSPGLTHVDFNNGLAAAIIAARILRTMARMHAMKA